MIKFQRRKFQPKQWIQLGIPPCRCLWGAGGELSKRVDKTPGAVPRFRCFVANIGTGGLSRAPRPRNSSEKKGLFVQLSRSIGHFYLRGQSESTEQQTGRSTHRLPRHISQTDTISDHVFAIVSVYNCPTKDITVLVGFPYGNDNNGLTVFVCLLGILNGRPENVDKWWKSYIEPAIGLWEEGKRICIWAPGEPIIDMTANNRQHLYFNPLGRIPRETLASLELYPHDPKPRGSLQIGIWNAFSSKGFLGFLAL